MAIVFTKTSQEILLDLINQSQTPESTLVSGDLSFGSASDNTGEGLGDTMLEVTATAQAAPVTGSVVVTYNRVDIASVVGTKSVVFDVTTETNYSDLLTAINARYGINLATADIVDGPIPTATAEGTSATLTIAAGALVFKGTLEITLDVPDVALSSVITNTELNGLTFTAE